MTRLLLYERLLVEGKKGGIGFAKLPPMDVFSNLTASEGATARAPEVSEQEFMEMEVKRRLHENRVRVEGWRQEVSELCGGYPNV